MVCQIIPKKQEEKRIEKEQAAKAQNWKLPVCYNNEDDEERSNSLKDNITSGLPPCAAITPNEPVDSLSMGDEHLDTVPVTESDEFIKFSVENLVPNPSESEVENGCDVPACFTTFSNVLFDAEYEFDSVDDHGIWISEACYFIGRDSSRVVLAFTSFFFFCMSLEVNVTVLPDFLPVSLLIVYVVIVLVVLAGTL
nr:hypothetical protein [Tanacetum cinerariifolium]